MIYLRRLLRESDELHSISEITPSVKREIAIAAQKIYDDWDQEGEHDELNGGGICHIIADGIIEVLYNHKIDDCQTVSSNFEQHVYVVGRFKEGIYSIDIPYSIYEKGGGFTWKKIPGVIFSEHDIQIYHLDSDSNNLDQYVDMMENTGTLTLESMTMSYVSNESDGERMGRLDTLLGLSGHLESLLYRIIYTLPSDQIAYFRKNRKPYLLIPDGDADIFSPTGVLNLYYAGYTKSTLELLLRAIFAELKKRNITCAAPKIEDSKSYNCKVVRLNITSNNYKHEGPDDINLSNRNFYHILKSILGFEPDDSSGSSFSFTVKELKDKINLVIKHDVDWISKNQIKNIPDAEKGDDDVEEENPHSAILKHTFDLLGPTHHISELDKNRIMDILNRLLKYCIWCEKHGYKNLHVG